MSDCTFCTIVNNPPDYTVYADQFFTVIPDRESLGKGHCIIIPKTHIEGIYELDEYVYIQLFSLAKKLSNVLKTLPGDYRSFPNTGVLQPVFTSVEYTVFNSSAHAHLHLVPHTNPDVLINPSTYIKKLSNDELLKNSDEVKEILQKYETKQQ